MTVTLKFNTLMEIINVFNFFRNSFLRSVSFHFSLISASDVRDHSFFFFFQHVRCYVTIVLRQILVHSCRVNLLLFFTRLFALRSLYHPFAKD